MTKYMQVRIYQRVSITFRVSNQLQHIRKIFVILYLTHIQIYLHKAIYSRVKYTGPFAVKAGIVGDCNMLVAEAMQPSGRLRLPNGPLWN